MPAQRPLIGILAAVLACLSLGTLPDEAGAIEAVRGKRYRITPAHGPWMILVADLYGKNALPASDALVYELRQRGIPAYSFKRRGETAGRKRKELQPQRGAAAYRPQPVAISVIAGNYPTNKDWRAQKTLRYLKRFQPLSITGGHYEKTPGQPSPFSGAFLIRNPLSPNREKAVDDLTRQLNRGERHTLFGNRGKYTLIVATWMGRSQISVDIPRRLRSARSARITNSLDVAAVKSRRLVKILNDPRYLARLGRKNPKLASLVARKRLRAFVLHERYRSIVTIGEFESRDDPLVQQFYDLFRAKPKPDPRTGQSTLTPEYIQVPVRGSRDLLDRVLVFDPAPKLLQVPRLR